MEKYIKKIPAIFYYSLSLILIIVPSLNLDLEESLKPTIYFLYSILHIPAGLGSIIYSYSYMKSYKPQTRIYPLYFGMKIPIAMDTIFYSLFILLGSCHLIFFMYLVFYIVAL